MTDTVPRRDPLLVLSCSLNPDSRSHRLAVAATDAAATAGHPCELVDIRASDLPLCDGRACYEHPAVQPLTDRVAAAGAVVIASPIYNYDFNAAAKNVVELTGRAWTGKVVGLLCAAGGRHSYMSPMGLANSLMFDFRCYLVPRFVYATPDDFSEAKALSPDLVQRVRQLVEACVDLAAALAWVRRRPARS